MTPLHSLTAGADSRSHDSPALASRRCRQYLCLRYGDRLSPAVGSLGAVLQTVVHVSVLVQAAAVVTAAITGLTRTPALLITAAVGTTYAALVSRGEIDAK